MSEPKNIEVQKIRFGDPDALHEFMKQDKDGSLVLQNSFVAPPRTSLSELKSGSKFPISFLPLNDLLHSNEIIFLFEKATSSLGSSGSTSSVFQKRKPSKDEHALRTKIN